MNIHFNYKKLAKIYIAMGVKLFMDLIDWIISNLLTQ